MTKKRVRERKRVRHRDGDVGSAKAVRTCTEATKTHSLSALRVYAAANNSEKTLRSGGQHSTNAAHDIRCQLGSQSYIYSYDISSAAYERAVMDIGGAAKVKGSRHTFSRIERERG